MILNILKVIGTILLWILRIIGIILAVILGLILLILFVPFRYKAKGNFDDGFDVKVHFSWLLYFINGFYMRDGDKDATVVRIWFIKVYDSRKKEAKEKKKEEKEAKKLAKENRKKGKEAVADDKEKDKSDTGEDIEVKPSEEIIADEVESTQDAKPSEEPEPIEVEKTSELKKDTNEQSVVEKPKGIKDTIKEEISKEISSEIEKDKEVKDKKTKDKESKEKKTKDKKVKKEKEPNPALEQVKKFWNFLQEPENEGVLGFIKKYLVKVLKWILPRKVYINMELGLEDPALTGYIAGITSIVYARTKRHVHVVPNFHEQVIKGSFKVKGRLFLFQLLYYIIRVILDKRVRRLIKLARG